MRSSPAACMRDGGRGVNGHAPDSGFLSCRLSRWNNINSSSSVLNKQTNISHGHRRRDMNRWRGEGRRQRRKDWRREEGRRKVWDRDGHLHPINQNICYIPPSIHKILFDKKVKWVSVLNKKTHGFGCVINCFCTFLCVISSQCYRLHTALLTRIYSTTGRQNSVQDTIKLSLMSLHPWRGW